MKEEKGNNNKPLKADFKLAWQTMDVEETKTMMAYAEDYKNFLDHSKTERLCAQTAMDQALSQGFLPLAHYEKKGKLKPGDKVAVLHRGKSLMLFVMGKDPLEKGMLVVGAHLDCPRLDLKPMPLYEDTDMAFFKTHYYGGLKKYQWLTIPLALYGTVVKKDGSIVNVALGDGENDPVFCITDLLPHLSQELQIKKLSEAFPGESLNPLVASRPIDGEDDKETIKATVLQWLNDQYGMTEEDFASAELEIVPAGYARDIGFDRSMIGAFGQDDRICAYAALRGIFDAKDTPQKTQCIILADKEEIGSYGNTGMQSRFFENQVAELLSLLGYADTSLALRRCFGHSLCLSADVTAAYDPNYTGTHDLTNASFAGKGVALKKYGGARGKSGGSDANPEFLAGLRQCFDEANVTWQLGEMGRVDLGGGGTIAWMLANYDMEVVDCGTPILSMHAPFEQSMKTDAYMTYKCYRSFLDYDWK